MERCNWKGVPVCNCQLVFRTNAFPGQIAKRAAINSKTVGFAHSSEISLVPISLLDILNQGALERIERDKYISGKVDRDDLKLRIRQRLFLK